MSELRPALRRFALLFALAPVLGGASCSKSTVRDEQRATIQYDLGIQAQTSGDVRQALTAYENAIASDSEFEPAENALGILYHLSFNRPEQAEAHFKRALQIKPNYSEAKVNLGNLYLSLERYDDAIAQYEQALSDLMYRKPHIAQNNMGWALFKKGENDRALQLIGDAVRANPDFCQGHRNLGLIHSSQRKWELARLSFDKFTRKCPEQAEGWYRLAEVATATGDAEGARANFVKCRDLARETDPLLEACSAAVLGGGK